MYKEKIVNVETGEESFRELSAEEIQQIEIAQAEASARAALIAEQAAARRAIFERLGLTDEEVKLIFG